MLAVARHFVEGDFVPTLVFADIDDRSDDGQSLLVKALYHLQFVKEQKITVIAAVLPQFLILEHAEQPQFHQLHDFLAVKIDGILAEEDVILQKFLIINIIVTVFCQTFDLLDEQCVQSLGAEGVDGDLRLCKRNDKQG